MKLLRLLVPVLFSSFVTAQDPPEKTRVLCDVADPQKNCPGPDCLCLDDTLEITFDGNADSVFQYESFAPGMNLSVTLVTETRTADVTGWSCGVQHDTEALSITDVTVAGTDGGALVNNGFVLLRWQGVKSCGTDPNCEEAKRTGGGWLGCVLFSTQGAVSLPVKRNTLARARYALTRDVGEEGTLLQVTDRLAPSGSPPLDLCLYVGDSHRTKEWTTTVDGWIKKSAESGDGSDEKVRIICDAADPLNKCPGPECVCVEDTFEVTFDRMSDSVFEYDTFTPSMPVEATIVTDTKTEAVVGWSYGVAHDREDLTILEATIEGTDLEPLLRSGFVATYHQNIESCGPDPQCDSENRTPGGGWISAIVISMTEKVSLPIKRNTIARASYRLDRDVGGEGTLIQITDRLAPRNSPRTDINLSAGHPGAKVRKWTTAIDGWVRKDGHGGPDPGEKSRVLCDAQDPARQCPGEDCVCVEDSLEITFDGMSGSTYEYEEFVHGMPVEVTVVMDVKSASTRAWSYGVAHDPGALTISNATIEGTDVVPLLSDSFVATSKDDVQTCGADLDCDPANRTDGGGWISAVIPSLTQAVFLPVTRNTIARASYILERDVGEAGTLLQFTNRLAKRLSPPADLNLTIGHPRVEARLWTTVVEGWVKRAGTCGTGVPFIRGDVGTAKPGQGYGADKVLEIGDALRILRALFLDAELVFDCEKAADVDDSGEINLGDAVRLLLYLFLGGSEPPAPFGIPGLDATPDELKCCSYPA